MSAATTHYPIPYDMAPNSLETPAVVSHASPPSSKPIESDHATIPNSESTENGNAPPPLPDSSIAEKRMKKRLSRKRSRRNAALRARSNTSVYVSDLPSDITLPEIHAHFAKCGIILPNSKSGAPSIKLYKDENDHFHGNALVTYALRPSVENAIELLHESYMRPRDPRPIRVEEASFGHKKPRVDDGNRVDKERQTTDSENVKPSIPIKQLIQESLNWADDDAAPAEPSATARIVILRNVFDPNSHPPPQYGELREDMHDGCTECGHVERVTVFQKSRVGAVAVKFGTVRAALKCVKMMDGRWFDGRILEAAFYDGITDYRHKESQQEKDKRDKEWEEWLQDGGEEDAEEEQEDTQQQEEKASPDHHS